MSTKSRKQKTIDKKKRFQENIRKRDSELQRVYTPLSSSAAEAEVVNAPAMANAPTESFVNGDSASANSPSMPNLGGNADSEGLSLGASADKNFDDSLRQLTLNSNRFMQNFNPETSSRERRKLNRKIRNAGTTKRHPGALYDDQGIHIASGQDICDCLFPNCSGCFYECTKCTSTKCGFECRVNRKFVYEQVVFEGINLTLKFQDIAKEF